MCACYLTIQCTTLVGAFEIRFRTLVYEQLETRETLTLTLTPTLTLIPNPNGKLFESDYWHVSCPLYCKLADAHLYISRPWSSARGPKKVSLDKWSLRYGRRELLPASFSECRLLDQSYFWDQWLLHTQAQVARVNAYIAGVLFKTQ